MLIDDFKLIISTFSDPGSEMLFEKSKIMFSIDGELIDASIKNELGDILVDDGTGTGFIHATSWIIKRLAKLPLLASRLKEMIPSDDLFVTPAANILQSLEKHPDESVNYTENAVDATFEALNNRSPLETTVLYITSDAGEGKTSLINKMAHEQAKKFLDNNANWLLVPIPLGGRHFLRFDDITVGALQNRYRFSSLYYNSFLALVRMGVIVPAFDGFEEMFVENSSGEALSAMGLLVGALNSAGAVVIAARKAYFEFENLKAQEKLYNSISNFSVGFGKVEIQRWTKKQFLEYCNKRSISNSEAIYNCVSERLKPDHSLLTRPVLVKRLVDIAEKSSSLESFLEEIQKSGVDFFSVFVRGIIEREANEKWIDRSGDIGLPLLTVDEHCELLSLVAISMWESRVDYLKRDHLESISDYFSESKRKTSQQAQQIHDRLRGHALLITSQNANSAVEFDHDEFRLFFLGEGVAEQIKPLTDSVKAGVLGLLRRGVLPEHSQIAFIRAVNRYKDLNLIDVAKFLVQVGLLDGHASYTQENCANLTVRLINGIDASGLKLENLNFGIDSLRDQVLNQVEFSSCYFSSSSLETTTLRNCIFQKCRFGQLRIFSSTKIDNSMFSECDIDTIRLEEHHLDIWEPMAIRKQLENLGAIFLPQESYLDSDIPLNQEMDEELVNIEKLLRYFKRSTHIGESVIFMKLGTYKQEFMDKTLPELLKSEVLCEIDNRGGVPQRRFKLGQPLEKINEAMSSAQGSYSLFISNLSSG